MIPISAGAQNIGIALSQDDGTVTVFDDSGIIGSMTLGGGFPLVGDCAFTPDGSQALVTHFQDKGIYVIDMSDPTNPVLAAGTNPIPVSVRAEDISMGPNGQFAAVCGVSEASVVGDDEFVSSINIAGRVEVDTWSVPAPQLNGCTVVEICDDGVSVLIIEGRAPDQIRRLTMDGAGMLTDTTETLATLAQGVNLACAPGSQSGAVVTSQSGNGQTFLIPGLAQVNTPVVPTVGQGVRINPAGDQLYFRSTNGTQQINAYGYNSLTGAVGGLLFTINAPFDVPWLGIDTFEINPDGATFSVTDNVSDQVVTYSTADGSVVALPAAFGVAVSPTGICFGPPADADGDGVLNVDDVCPGTTIPESIPAESLGINRFALTDGDGDFDTVVKGHGTPHSYSIQDTTGCSCEQIADELDLGGGQTKFGCSNSVMETWVDLVNP